MRMSPTIWFDARVVAVSSILSGTILAFSAIGAASAERDTEALVKDALSAAPPIIAKTAMVMDWDGTMLRQGSDAYVCHPTPPDIRAKGGREPMCMDKTTPDFAGVGDYRLKPRARSANNAECCIDKATKGPAWDYFDTHRPLGAGFDIGFHEVE